MAERAVPILPSRDLRASVTFWERLGFTDVGDPPDAWGYAILRRGDLVVHLVLAPDVDPSATASSCYLYVDDAPALARAWAPLVTPDPATGSRFVPGGPTDHGMWEFAVVDPSGNLVRVGTALEAT